MKFVIYKDEQKEWRWRLVSFNGNIIGDGAEGYKNRKDCAGEVARIMADIQEGIVQVEFAKK